MSILIEPILKRYINSYSGLPKASRYGLALSFIESVLGGICFFLSFYFVKELHIKISIAGIIISFYAIGTAFGGIIGGKLSDASSPKKVAAVSLLIESLAFLGLSFTHNVIALIVILFILGASTYSFLTANNTWTVYHCGKNETARLQAINLLYVSSNFGLGLAAVIIILLANKSFAYIFLLASLSLLISAITLFIHKNNLLAINGSLNINNEKRDVINKQKSIVLVASILTCLFLVGIIIAQRTTVYLIYIHDLFPTSGILGVALVFILNPLLIVIFQAPIINELKNTNKVLNIGLGAFLMGFGMCILSISFSFFFIILAVIIYTLGEMMFFSMAQYVCYQHWPENKKGQIIGIFKTVYATSAIIGPAASGIMYHRFGSHFLWYLDGVFALICLTICFYVKRYD